MHTRLWCVHVPLSYNVHISFQYHQYCLCINVVHAANVTNIVKSSQHHHYHLVQPTSSTSSIHQYYITIQLSSSQCELYRRHCPANTTNIAQPINIMNIVWASVLQYRADNIINVVQLISPISCRQYHQYRAANITNVVHAANVTNIVQSSQHHHYHLVQPTSSTSSVHQYHRYRPANN